MPLTGPLRKTSDALRWAFGFCVTGSIVTIGLSLSRWGAAEVRSDGSEVLLLTFIGAIWLALGLMVFPWMGVSYRDDVVERRNPAALVALCGATFGLALIYAGGGIGEGPSYGDNFFSAGLGTCGLFAAWLVLEMGGKVSVSIVEERDLASGIRTGGLFIAIGLVLGRAVAGDWVSESATLRDFFRDNRSISFTSDFPSSHFLAAHGIQRVLLIQKDRLEPQADLAHSLRRWQEGGLQLERVRLDGASTPEPFQVARPPWYGAMFQRMLSSLGFRRAAGGGFGAWLPDASAGG